MIHIIKKYFYLKESGPVLKAEPQMNLNFEVKWKMITSNPECCLHFPQICLVNAFIGNLALKMMADSEIPSEKHLTLKAYFHPQKVIVKGLSQGTHQH